jgi:hypothetical protein
MRRSPKISIFWRPETKSKMVSVKAIVFVRDLVFLVEIFSWGVSKIPQVTNKKSEKKDPY